MRDRVAASRMAIMMATAKATFDLLAEPNFCLDLWFRNRLILVVARLATKPMKPMKIPARK